MIILSHPKGNLKEGLPMKFVPYEKMSKKAQKEYNAQKRGTWQFNPVTRVTKNGKAYSRKNKWGEQYA